MRQQGEMVAEVARTSVLVVTTKEEESTGELWQAEFETAATRTRFNVAVARLAEISNCSEVGQQSHGWSGSAVRFARKVGPSRMLGLLRS